MNYRTKRWAMTAGALLLLLFSITGVGWAKSPAPTDRVVMGELFARDG